MLAALAGLVLADRAAQSPVPWSSGARWVGGTCLVLAAGLLLAGLLLRRRWFRHERISAFTSASVIREAGRAYRCWFVGHGLLWIGLPLLVAGLLLRGLGSQLPVLVLVAGAATAAVHTILGLVRRPAPGQLLGLCWQLLAPAPGSLLVRPVAWTETVVSSRHRLAAARRLDRSRAGQHRPLFRQMQDVLDLETVLPHHRRLRLGGGLARPVTHELLVRSMTCALLVVIGMVVTGLVLALQAGWATLLPPGAVPSRIVFARHAALSPVPTAVIEPTPTPIPTPAPGGGAQEQPAETQGGETAPSSQEAVAPGPGQAHGPEESEDGAQGAAAADAAGSGGAGGQETGGEGAPGKQQAGGSASQPGPAAEGAGAEGAGAAGAGGQQAAAGQGEAGNDAGDQAGAAGGQGASGGSGAEGEGMGEGAGITSGAGGAGAAGAGDTAGAAGGSGPAGATGGEPGQGSAGSGGQPGGGGSGESADGAPGTSGALGQSGGGLTMAALAPPAPDQLVTVELPVLGMAGPDPDQQPTPALPAQAGEQAPEPLPQPTVRPASNDPAAADKEPRQPLPAWVQQILELTTNTGSEKQEQ